MFRNGEETVFPGWLAKLKELLDELVGIKWTSIRPDKKEL